MAVKTRKRKIHKKAGIRRTLRRRYEQILCAGFGGQGIMFMGKLLAHAGLLSGKHVTWMPSYGAEVRGGTAYSMTRISDREIASPVVVNPHILVVMNKPSLIKYEGRLAEGGILIFNKSLIDGFSKRKGVVSVGIAMTELASRMGDARCANMIAVGALLKRSKILSIRSVVTALKEILKGKEGLFAINKKALKKGFEVR